MVDVDWLPHVSPTGYQEIGGQKTFTAKDYMAKTPHLDMFGAKEQGFDPSETWFFRKTKKDIGGC